MRELLDIGIELEVDINKESIHNIYNELLQNKDVIHNLEIDKIYYCCNTYNTLLSYSFYQNNINLDIIDLLFKYGYNPHLIFHNNNTPLSYLIMKQNNYNIIKILNDLVIDNNTINTNYYIELSIHYDNYYFIQYLLTRTNIYYFDDIINNKLISVNKINWLYSIYNTIYYLLLLGSKIKQNHLYNLPNDIIVLIYKKIFVS